MQLLARAATKADAAAIATVRTRAAERLTLEHGQGPWSWPATEQGVLRDIASSRVLVACSGDDIVGSLRLQTAKPWVIDPSYFARIRRPLYLVDMVVEPDVQRRGIGRFLIEQARAAALAWPADAIRLDAFDSPAGAGPFYIKCGLTEVGRVVYRGVPHVYFELLLK